MPQPRPSEDDAGRAHGHFDAVIVGAGLAGLYMLHRLRRSGLTARVLEAGSGIGGTWFWNRYPGARCDIESLEYSYQFSEELQQEWVWSERYAAQPEILRYIEHVADRFDLRRDISCNTRVESAIFDEAAGRWVVRTADGGVLTGRFCIMATGCLSSTNIPAFEGRDSFAGRTYHTGAWPHEGVDFTGQRVAVIGTGSSAVQSIPHIAAQARQLFVFQRTANYVVPARNRPLDAATQAAVKANYPELRRKAKQHRSGQLYPLNDRSALEVTEAERWAEYEGRWQKGGLGFMGSFRDLLLDRRANDTAAEFLRGKVREIVTDPAVAEALCPDSVVGCKRLCVDIGYYETFNRPNVTLVDLRRGPIEAISPAGIRAQGREYAVDAIVFATGFDAMTGALARIDIRGREGVPLRDRWAAGPRSYLGLMIAGFPNLFTITGPGSPSVLSNMLPTIEHHVEWIAQCLDDLRSDGHSLIEADSEAEDAWVAHVNEIAGRTLYPSCNSWYLGANVPGKPRVFMPYVGCPPYWQRCAEIAAEGYPGFTLG